MRLNTPPQLNTPGVDTRIGPLRNWLDGLPYTNALRIAEQLTRRLEDINHQVLPSAQHFELVSAFNAPYERVHEMLRSLSKSAEPTAAPQLQALRELTRHLLQGYKYIINNAQQEKTRWGKPKHLPHAVNYAAHLTSLQIAGDCQVYLPIDRALWYEAAQLLVFAENQHFPGTPNATLPLAPVQLSARHSYPLNAMLRLADPYRLPPGYIWDAFKYLSTRINLVHVEAPLAGDPQSGQYTLHLHCDPVEALQLKNNPDSEPPWRSMDARELIQTLQGDIKRLESDTPPLHLGLSDRMTRVEALQLLNTLLSQWLHHRERKLPRVEHTGTVTINLGLPAAFRLHNQGIAFDPNDFLSAQDDHEIDLSAILGDRASQYGDDISLTCTGINRSAGGLAIRVPDDAPRKLRVGEIVTVAPDPAQPDNRLVGTVRWVVNHEQQDMQAGIQYIAKGAHPIAIRPLDAGDQTPFQPGLLSHFQQGETLFELVIAAHGLFRPGRLLELDQNGERQRRTCGQMIEASGIFERFSLAPE